MRMLGYPCVGLHSMSAFQFVQVSCIVRQIEQVFECLVQSSFTMNIKCISNVLVLDVVMFTMMQKMTMPYTWME